MSFTRLSAHVCDQDEEHWPCNDSSRWFSSNRAWSSAKGQDNRRDQIEKTSHEGQETMDHVDCTHIGAFLTRADRVDGLRGRHSA